MNPTELAYRKTAVEGASGFGLMIALYDTLAGNLRRAAVELDAGRTLVQVLLPADVLPEVEAAKILLLTPSGPRRMRSTLSSVATLSSVFGSGITGSPFVPAARDRPCSRQYELAGKGRGPGQRCRGRRLRCECGNVTSGRHNHGHLPTHQIGGERR